jgi:hypothetical protein
MRHGPTPAIAVRRRASHLSRSGNVRWSSSTERDCGPLRSSTKRAVRAPLADGRLMPVRTISGSAGQGPNVRSGAIATRQTEQRHACSRVPPSATVRRERGPVVSRLLLVVRLSSERVRQAVPQDCSFAEKQASPPALLVRPLRERVNRRPRRSPSWDGALCPHVGRGVDAELLRLEDTDARKCASCLLHTRRGLGAGLAGRDRPGPRGRDPRDAGLDD